MLLVLSKSHFVGVVFFNDFMFFETLEKTQLYQKGSIKILIECKILWVDEYHWFILKPSKDCLSMSPVSIAMEAIGKREHWPFFKNLFHLWREEVVMIPSNLGWIKRDLPFPGACEVRANIQPREQGHPYRSRS